MAHSASLVQTRRSACSYTLACPSAIASSFLWITLFFLISLSCIPATTASPLEFRITTPMPSSTFLTLVPRARVVINNATGQPIVLNPATNQVFPQGRATDAGGKDFDVPALIWLIFSFVIGIPMSLAGIRGWRLSTGVGMGLAGAVASWAAVINSIGPSGVSDLVITIIVLAFFALGFVFGVLEFGRISGMTMLGATGGLAFGIRIIILKPNLLFSGSILYATNWVIIALLGLGGGMSMIWKKSQRAGLVLGCASIGTFLTFLGADLIINKQAGMSRGLRYLFDRNASHFLDIIGGGYKPPTSTQIITGASLAATFALAFAQHYFFKQPFRRRPRDDDSDEEGLDPGSEVVQMTAKPGRPSAVPVSQKQHKHNGSVFRGRK